MKLLFNFATRSRPEKCLAGLDNITQLIKTDNYQIIVTADVDDPSMCNDEMRDKINAYPNTKVYYGISTGKINAINKNTSLAEDDWQILINYSDDMFFLVKEFDQVIIKAFEDNFPDTDGFVHFFDGNQPRLATLSVIGRVWYERFGYVYHPDYISLFCDNAAQDVAIKLKKYKYMGDDVKILHHLHPIFVKTVKGDAQYTHTESFYEVDRATYHRHQKNNFGLPR